MRLYRRVATNTIREVIIQAFCSSLRAPSQFSRAGCGLASRLNSSIVHLSASALSQILVSAADRLYRQ
jgi:hypothetical protein